MAVSAKFIADFSSFQQAVAKAEVSLKSFETGAGRVEKELNKMSNSFSGTRIIQDANLMAAAIQRAGGASTLTAAEQSRVNAQVTEAIAKYRALGQSAPQALHDLEVATRKVEAPTEGLVNKLSLADRASGLLKSSFAQFTVAGIAANAVSGVATKLAEFVSQGAKLPGLQASFERLTDGIKTDGAQMLGALQGATRGLVSDIDLMQSSNKALLLGLPVTQQSMTELAKTATVLGKAMGQDATASLDDLITALGRSSPMILDNLGLTVKVGEANEAYAKKIGKTVEQMTDAEKKMAFYEAAMEAARMKTQQLGEQTLTLGERMQQAWTATANFVSKSSSDINVVLGDATESWSKFFAFMKNAATFTTWEEMAAKLRTPKVGSLPYADPGALARPSQIYLEEQAEIDKAYERSKQAAKDYAKAIAQMRTELSGDGAIKAARDMVEALKGLPPAYKLSRDAQKQINAAMNEAIEAYRVQGKEAPTAIRQIAAATFDLNSLTPKVADGLPTAIEWIGRQAKAAVPEIIALYGAIEKGLPRIQSGLAGLTFPSETKVDVSKIPLPKIPPTALQQIFGSASDMGAALSGAILAAVQGGGNPFEAAGSLLGSKLTGSLANYLTRTKDAMGKELTPILSGWIGGAVTALLPGLGALLGPIMGKIKEVFGGPSAAELAGRGVVDAFEKQLQSGLSASTKLAAGNESWKLTTIAVRDAYVAAGKTVAEAEAAVAKLWESSRGGAKAAELAVLEIQAVMEKVTGKQAEMADATLAQKQAMEDATAGVRGRIAELTSEYDRLFDSIKDEAPEEVMGIVEAQTRARMEAISQERATAQTELERITSQMERSFESVAEAAEAAAKRIGDAFGGIRTPSHGSGGVTIDVPAMASGGIVRKPTLALIGEAGPEAVVPLGRGGSGGATQQVVQVMLDRRVLVEEVFRGLPDVAQLYVR